MLYLYVITLWDGKHQIYLRFTSSREHFLVNKTSLFNKKGGRMRTESGGTRRRTGGEVKGKEANGVGSQQSSA